MKKLVLIMFSFFFGNLLIPTASSIKSQTITQKNRSAQVDNYVGQQILSYELVYQYYYNKAVSSLSNESKAKVSLEDFINAYRNQNLSIYEFTDSFSLESLKYDGEDKTNKEVSISSLEIISPDANYILGADSAIASKTEKKYYRYQPTYLACDYSQLNDGDIIYESQSPSPTKHCAFIYDSEHDGYYGNYVQTIEAVAGGVQYGFLDDQRMIDYGVVIYRVYRASELNVVSRAKKFIIKQVGKPYSIDFTKTDTDENESEWYCSELVYAAYFAGGMNIASTSSYNFDPTTTALLPVQLTWGMFNGIVTIVSENVDISISSFTSASWNNSYWTIKVYNPNYYAISIQYNSKMCNDIDAKEWTSLSDIKTISLDGRKSTTVDIKQNWFATAVTFSYVNYNTNKRYITYGTQLTKGVYTMQVGYNVKDLRNEI